jgi:hypothetical protein
MDANTILFTDREPYRELFYLATASECYRSGIVTFLWAAPQPCKACPGGLHYLPVKAGVSLN